MKSVFLCFCFYQKVISMTSYVNTCTLINALEEYRLLFWKLTEVYEVFNHHSYFKCRKTHAGQKYSN